MWGRIAQTFQRRTMATAPQDPIQKLFVDQLKKASAKVYKSGAVSKTALPPIHMKRREERGDEEREREGTL